MKGFELASIENTIKEYCLMIWTCVAEINKSDYFSFLLTRV